MPRWVVLCLTLFATGSAWSRPPADGSTDLHPAEAVIRMRPAAPCLSTTSSDASTLRCSRSAAVRAAPDTNDVAYEPLQGFEPVTFLFANSLLLPEARSILFRLVDWLRARPGQPVELRGYADPAKETAFHDEIARERAEAVRTFLVDQGIAPGQLTIRSMGMADPVGALDAFEGRRANRRVAFFIPVARPQPAPAPPAPRLSPSPASEAIPAHPDDPPSAPLPGGLDPASGGWTIVVASAPSYEEAERAAAAFTGLGYPLDVLRILSREKKEFRVGLGQFFVFQKAQQVQRELAAHLPAGNTLMRLRPGM